MTTAPSITDSSAYLRQRFNYLPEDLLDKLLESVRPLRFNSGDIILRRDIVPSSICLITSGIARVLIDEETSPSTLQKLSEGDWIGLASYLLTQGCESIAVSTNVEAVSIPGELVLELVNNDLFYQYECKHVFAAEIYQLVAKLSQDFKQKPSQSLAAYSAELLESAFASSNTDFQSHPEYCSYVGSANFQDFAYGDVITSSGEIPRVQKPLPGRILYLPLTSQLQIQLAPTASLTSSPDDLAFAKTGLDLGRTDDSSPESGFTLIEASGDLAVLKALFEMASKLSDVPFRRDALDRVLREHINRSQEVDIPFIGSLLAMSGLHVTSSDIPCQFFHQLSTPSILPWKDSFAILLKSNSKGLLLASPVDGYVTLDRSECENFFEEGFKLLHFERTLHSSVRSFGLDWFLPSIRKYKSSLIQVFLSSFVVQIFGLAGPLLVQVIIDKVINQRSLDTLQVLGFGLVIITLVEGVLSTLRTFIFTETTNRIDLRLGSEIIDHLLRLPLQYFDRRPVGELSSRFAELEKIRQFLTGQALTTFLDAILSVIYIIVMLFYSWLLTLIALSVVPIQVGLTLLGGPLFRRQYRDTANENAKTQSHLVEVITGIQTVKAQNIETISRWKWQDKYAKYMSKSFEKVITGTLINESSQVLQKLSQLLVLWVGASLVLNGELTLGQLIAFRILSGYVTQPILRLSSIWQNIQELKISFERLADVVDTKQESDEADQGKTPMPFISGAISFDNVTYTFPGADKPTIDHVTLDIPTGSFVGIVGQSGSGKSTLTKLISRLYTPSSGVVYIDGIDVTKVELYSLRRQIGIVPQDPLLFSGSISENIALASPNATSDQIIEAAKLACAHDFIMELQNGYSTFIGERGAGLSGGQRQRLALARTLILKPKLLILDEATSALDYQTESLVCQNLRDNLQSCTVLFVTHRLSTIKPSSVIFVMESGFIAEMGTHDDLLSMKGRYYALLNQQEVV